MRPPEPRRLPIVALAVLPLVAIATAAAAQTVDNLQFDPMVIPAGYAGTVRVEAAVSGAPGQVSIRFQPGGLSPVNIAATDDGTNGDRIAGDHIYTALVPAAPILSAQRPDDVQRVFFGYLILTSASNAQIFQGNLFIDVLTPDIATRPVQQYSQFVQATDHLVNVWDAGFFTGFDVTRVTKTFYQFFGDDYDFIAVISTPERFLNRDHFQVQNSVTGTGLRGIDQRAAYGSAQRLTGISRFPIPTFFDGAETGFIHELGHQWIDFLNFAPLAQGNPHWPLSTMATGVMGFSVGGAGGEGGDYNCDILVQGGAVTLVPRADGPKYNDLDLYLMGLIPASEVGPQFVFADQVLSHVTCVGQRYTGATIPVTVDDIVSHAGARNPAPGSAPTHFRVADILVTRDALAAPETMSLYSWFAERAELQQPTPTHSGFEKRTDQPFYVATGGRATLDTSVGSSEPQFTITVQPSASVATGDSITVPVSVAPSGASFDGPVSLTCGPSAAHSACRFSPATVTPGARAVSSQLTVSTKDGTTAAVGGADRHVLNLWLPATVLGAIVWRRRRRLARALLIGTAVCLTGCNPPPPTPTAPPSTVAAGTYVFTVIGTSGSMQQTASLTLTVH